MTQFMQAHGYAPGPTQRPVLTGLLTGIVAGVASVLVLLATGLLQHIAGIIPWPWWGVLLVDAAVLIIAGAVYGRIFRRAANDRRGGWLFGISYGFLLWMLGPVTIIQTVRHQPLAIGGGAVILFGSYLLYGLILGLLFPPIHQLLQRELKEDFAPQHLYGAPHRSR